VMKCEENDIVSFISKFHAGFEKIHPFSDGNGRVGRLLITAILLQKNLAPAIIEKDLKYLYYTYLENAQENENYDFLELFLAEAILKGYKEVE
jgi:Fic family protein